MHQASSFVRPWNSNAQVFCVTGRVTVFIWLAALLCISEAIAADEPVDYLTQVKPILQQRCYACHGALKQEAGLRLDTAALAIKGGESGAAVVAGELADSSILLKRVAATNAEERMPPSEEGEPLTAEQIELIRRWIAGGAKLPADEQPEADPARHWAFQPIVQPAVPADSSDWCRTPIDAFLEHHQRKHGITPQPEAPRIIQLRRLHLDLIGIPPTAEEIAACEADPSPLWYEQTVKRLLDDPRHGERWARHWMDIWRYSDWWGLGDQLRNSQKHIWHWRDWIVESLNADTPYDEMIRLMLAADEMHPNDLGKLRATGYLARNYWLFNRPQWMEETVEHVSKGFLGLTMNCARCHDHKYDPIAQEDYYRLRAFFEPYHVRLDVVPQEPDLTRDGIPRIFDGLPDEPTYMYVRGDERNPDKSRVIQPGVPHVLSFADLAISPVKLPEEAREPERRPWVLEAYISNAQHRSEAAKAEVQNAQQKLQAAESKEAGLIKKDEKSKLTDRDKPRPLLTEKFETLDVARWKPLGGNWMHSPGKLEQKMDGPTRAALRLLEKPPRDFEASVRFTILGGSQWRSVGITFDATQADPTQPASATDSEQNVYVSAVAGGSKVQAAWHRGGQWMYPGGEAVRAMPIELNRTYTLRVQVRGTLVNASLDDEPVIAWESPLPRNDGALQLITFDALCAFHEFTISPLDPKLPLRMPGSDPLNSPQTLKMAQAATESARADLKIAEAALVVADAEFESTRKRADAQRAEWDPADASRPEKSAAAIMAERRVQAEKNAHALAVAEKALLSAAGDKRAAAEKAVEDSRMAHDKSLAALQAEIKPEEKFTRMTGAAWTPTRFFNSGKDDPEVKFSSTSTGRRTALANWLTDRRNPLTARVAVNHIWTRHMGQPLVPTVFDFGRKGTPPVNQELLDWLAAELIESGWSMKHLHRLIAESAVYRLSSSVRTQGIAEGELGRHGDRETNAVATASSPDLLISPSPSLMSDPENRYWWRRVPIRLESQLVRDSLLSMAGTLDSTIGGPSIPSDQQATSTRRSLYFFHSNNERNLFLTTFDEALVKDCYRREQSIVPQQALALSNSQLALDSSKQIALRLSEGAADEADFVRKAFRVVTGINPTDAEVAASMAAMKSWRELAEGNSPDTARTNLIWALINHNDFVTLR
jgi:mono/diheme cytochrome c family protein